MALSPGPWTIELGESKQIWLIRDADGKAIAMLENRDDAQALILLLKLLNDFFDGADELERKMNT